MFARESGPSAEEQMASALDTIAAVLKQKFDYAAPAPQCIDENSTEADIKDFFGPMGSF
jgi:hypothetical protein